MTAKIALVDDDRSILTSIGAMLRQEGFDVECHSDSHAALEAIGRRPPGLALLDVRMPRMDGMELLQRLRSKSQVPVIFLTARADEIDELLGLRLGADDYVRKPVSPRLLVERIRAVLRRHEAAGPPTREDDAPMVRGDLVMDPLRHQVTWRGRPVTLTVTEFLLVQALAQRPGFVKSRDQLMDVAYDDRVYVDDRTIDSHIKRLRRKFRVVDSDFDAIETLYGVGYRFGPG